MGRSNISGGRSGRLSKYNIEGLSVAGRTPRSNIEGLTAPVSGATPAQKAAMQRQNRAYIKLRRALDQHCLNLGHSIELPHWLSAWKPRYSVWMRNEYPGLTSAVQQIEALLHERRQTKAGVIAKSTDKRIPLPKDPVEREAERLRRAVASMRALRERRRGGPARPKSKGGRAATVARQSAKKRDPANVKNFDLIGL